LNSANKKRLTQEMYSTKLYQKARVTTRMSGGRKLLPPTLRQFFSFLSKNMHF